MKQMKTRLSRSAPTANELLMQVLFFGFCAALCSAVLKAHQSGKLAYALRWPRGVKRSRAEKHEWRAKVKIARGY